MCSPTPPAILSAVPFTQGPQAFCSTTLSLSLSSTSPYVSDLPPSLCSTSSITTYQRSLFPLSICTPSHSFFSSLTENWDICHPASAVYSTVMRKLCEIQSNKVVIIQKWCVCHVIRTCWRSVFTYSTLQFSGDMWVDDRNFSFDNLWMVLSIWKELGWQMASCHWYTENKENIHFTHDHISSPENMIH